MSKIVLSALFLLAGVHADHCTFPDDSVTELNNGNLRILQAIHPVQQTVTVQLEYWGEDWLAFGYGGGMIGSVAVIGLPHENQVLKHDLKFGAPQGVPALEDKRQTLTQTSITQEEGVTVLTFTKPLVEEGEPEVTVGSNRFIWAIGQGNNLTSTHSYRGVAEVDTILECLDAESNASMEESDIPTAESPSDAGSFGVIVLVIVCCVFLVVSCSARLCRKIRQQTTNRVSYTREIATEDRFKDLTVEDAELL